jgi:glyoxylate reductase
MPRPRVYVTRPIPDAGLKLILDRCDTFVFQGDIPPGRMELLHHVRGCDGLLTLLTEQIDRELLLAAGPQLKVVSNMAVGYDNIDVEAATELGILVGNTPGVLTETTADLAFALLAAAARRIAEGVDYVRAGKWQTWGPEVLLGYDLYEATLGIIGFGRIGQAMARRAAGFNMRVLFADPSDRSKESAATGAVQCDLNDLLKESDFVSLHAPSTDQTQHLIDAKAFSRMKPTAILVNTARGPLVDLQALRQALSTGTIAYAALDVTEPEPLPSNHPLLALPNCLVVPHIGSASHATRNKMAIMAAHNLLAGLQGQLPPNCVNPTAYP